MEYIRFNEDGEDAIGGHTHLDGRSDYTLCGITMDGDLETAGSWSRVTAPKLTCPDCVAIVKTCRNKAIKI